MMLLALDTTTDAASIALFDGESVLAELNWRSRRRHTIDLAPQVAALFALCETSVHDLTGVAVAIGPGSYTGTRIALSLAKGLIAARAMPLVGVPTLDVVVYPHLRAGTTVCAVLDAGRGRYAWAQYEDLDGWPRRVGEWRLDRISEILPQLVSPARIVGEIQPGDRAILPPDIVVSPRSLSVRRAGVLAALAWAKLARGETDSPETLSPIYLG